MPDFELPATSIPTSLRVRRQRRWRISHWMLAVFLLLAGLFLIRLAISIAGARSGPSPSATSTAGLTKAQFRSVLAQLFPQVPGGGQLAEVSESDLVAKFGQPTRTQTVMGEHYWYWNCTDGLIQLCMKKDQGTFEVEAINDY